VKLGAQLRIGAMLAGAAIAAVIAAGRAGWMHPSAALAAAARGGGDEVTGPAMSPVNPEVNDLKLSDKFENVLARIPGGEVAPCRTLEDPYPEFNGIAVDPQNGIAVLSDTNLKSALVYDINAGASPSSSEITPYKGWIKGPATYLSFAAGVALDPVRHDVAAFPYTANGNYKSRALAVPHGAYGIALSQKHKQMAVAIQHNAQIIFYRIQAAGAELPVRSIRGLKTKLADPHGVAWDDKDDEIFVTNYGNWSRGYWDADFTGGGHYYPPSIEVFSGDAKGDAPPRRVIQGEKTRLDWPTGIAVDNLHNLIAVAQEPTNEILIFRRTDDGDVAPVRALAGPETHIVHPMGVAFDPTRNELWVANFGHEAEVFDLNASGNAAPKRILRNAPAGTPAAGFGNPMALAYDSKRDVLLVPN
jgi:DNA-binding beta-propeller fold protein YncE